jgi:predicted anti-sigma-YlaC factor YlaD
MLLCVRYRTRLGAYLDGELSGKKGVAVERHLAGCDSCRTALDGLRALEPLLLKLDVPPPPSTQTSRILAEARARQRRRVGANPIRSWWDALTPQSWALSRVTTAALIVGLTMGAFMGWTTYMGGRTAQSSTVKTGHESVEEPLYALDVLNAAPKGSIEAAVLALLEDGR